MRIVRPLNHMQDLSLPKANLHRSHVAAEVPTIVRNGYLKGDSCQYWWAENTNLKFTFNFIFVSFFA